MTSKKLFIIFLSLFCLGPALPALGAEEILNFNSKILILQDGSMEVTETIQVRAEGRNIKRGIYRDFPTRYRDRLGHRYQVTFEVLAVERDGRAEPFHIKKQSNGARVYMGSSDNYLRRGTYTYSIKYRTDRQLGFFKDHDELYWNVTGNAWDFTIQQARATVALPSGISNDDIKFEAYTGPRGATEKNFRAWIDSQGQIHFVTTRPLPPGQGLTIVAGWPKGFVQEPGFWKRTGYLFRDNLGLIAGLFGLGLVFLYYFLVWLAVGKDPEKGAIFPRFEGPKNFSPAAVRYVHQMGFDNKTFAAALLNLAVKGYLSITQDGKTYILDKNNGGKGPLLPGEKKLYQKLPDHLELKKTNHAQIRKALTALRSALALQCERVYFLKNSLYMIPGIVISLAVLLLMATSQGDERTFATIFIIIWLTFWSMGVFSLARGIFNQWRAVLHGPGNAAVNAISATVLSFTFIPFFIGEIAGLVVLWMTSSFGVVLILLCLALTNYLFYGWLKAPTHNGRKIMDEIEGFRMFLTVSEQERLKLLNPPERTPELFEKYLPYALALDVEQLWAEQFTDVLTQAGTPEKPYGPSWYSGQFSSGNYSGLATSLGSSLTGVIASSSTAPGSRSGFSGGGGGGSSGGGGGGGGGGGW